MPVLQLAPISPTFEKPLTSASEIAHGEYDRPPAMWYNILGNFSHILLVL